MTRILKHKTMPAYGRLRDVIRMVIPGLLVVCLAGCSPRDDGVVRVRIWHQKDTAERLHFEKTIEAYNASVADHQVELLYKETEDLRNQFVIAAAGGKGPELLFGPADNVGLLELTKTILPLEEIFNPPFFEQFIDEGLVTWNGSTWLLADQVGNHLTLVYNTDLIETPPETVQELIRIGKEQTVDEDGDGVPERYGLTWNYREPFFFIPFLTGQGGWVMDADGSPTLDNEATVRAIQFILDLRDKHGIIPREADYETSQALFKEGRAAMIINGPWAWAGYGEAGIDYDLAPLPIDRETGLRLRPLTSAKGYSVNVNVTDDMKAYVRRVLTYLTGPEVQLSMSAELATIPVHIEAVDAPSISENDILQASLRQVRLARPMPIAPQMRQIWDGMRGPYQLVMNGAVDAREGADMMQEKVEKLIADTFL